MSKLNNGGNTANNTNDKNDAIVLADFLATLSFSTKRNGGKNGNDKTATFCKNPKTPRLYLPPRFYANGYRSGLTGTDDAENVYIVLSKNKHANAYTALHATQNFITVLGSTADVLRKTSYTYTITDEKPTDGGSLSLTLKPNGDTYKPKTAKNA